MRLGDSQYKRIQPSGEIIWGLVRKKGGGKWTGKREQRKQWVQIYCQDKHDLFLYMIRKGDCEDESDNDDGGEFDSNNGDWNNTIPNDAIKTVIV